MQPVNYISVYAKGYGPYSKIDFTRALLLVFCRTSSSEIFRISFYAKATKVSFTVSSPNRRKCHSNCYSYCVIITLNRAQNNHRNLEYNICFVKF